MTHTLVAVALAVAIPSTAAAQAQAQPPLRRLEAAVGAGWLGGAHLEEGSATLRGRGGDEFVLFRSDSRLAPAAAVEARIGYAVTRRFGVEARLAFSRPEVRTAITGDVEGAPPIALAERIDQYTVDGTAVVSIERLRRGRLAPFAFAGAGYVRQLHEGRTLVENGISVHVGGGVRQLLFDRDGFVTGGGVRGDARLSLFSGGIGAGDGPRPHAAISGSFFVTF